MLKLQHTAKGVWDNNSHIKGKELHRQFFDWLGTQLEYKDVDHWYNVTQDDIYQHGKGILFQHYDNSISQALQAVYPEHDWMMWRFGQKLKGIWEISKDKHRQFFD